jgi:hypothetical protein
LALLPYASKVSVCLSEAFAGSEFQRADVRRAQENALLLMRRIDETCARIRGPRYSRPHPLIGQGACGD